MSSPRMPCPFGSSPIAARTSSSNPTVMKSDRYVRVGSSTPKAQYLAPTSSRADSAMRCNTTGRLKSDPTDITASSRRRSCFAPAYSVATTRRLCTAQWNAVTRIFLLDDHEIVRRGLRELLEAEDDFEVVGEASTAAE